MKTFLHSYFATFIACILTATISAQAPLITNFSPTLGPVGTIVTITGTNFDPVAANNTVYFGAVKAMVLAATSTALMVKAPAGATYQPITATTAGLSGYSSIPFVLTSPCGGQDFTSTSFAPKIDFPTIIKPGSVVIGDLDGDGKSDLVVSRDTSTSPSSDTILFYQNTSTNGTIAFQVKNFVLDGSPSYIALSDLDGDGKLDLAVQVGKSHISLFKNASTNGVISFEKKMDLNIAGRIFISDLDGDGKPDVVVHADVAQPAKFSVFRNLSNSGIIDFDAKIDFPINSFGSSEGTELLTINDIDRDGKADILVLQETFFKGFLGNEVSVLKNTSTIGSISFSFRATNAHDGASVSSYFENVVVGDLDGDNKADLVVGHNYSVLAFRNTSADSAISFAAAHEYSTNWFWNIAALSDLDGDGKPDLVLTNVGSQSRYPSLSIMKNTSSVGDISFAPPVSFIVAPGEDYSLVLNSTVGDLNGDGRPELVTVNRISNSLSIFKNQMLCCTAPTFVNNGLIILDATCANNDGNINIIPTSGTAPFMYSINGGTTYVKGPDAGYGFQNLPSGTYKLRLKDANGCESAIVEREVKVNCTTACTPPTFVNNGLIILDATCANNDGNINIIPTSGTAPFMYSINGGVTYVAGPNAGYGFQNLPSGTYKLRLKDAKGCESAIVERQVKLLCTTCTPPTFVNNNLIVLDASCGKSDGAINIIPTSGTPPFMYSINGGATYVAGPNSGYGFQNLAAGTYQLRLKDSRGCESAIVERTVRNYYNCPGITVSSNPFEASLISNKDVIATYPNPNNGQFKLLLQNFTSSKAEVSIFDAKGTLIQKRSLNLTQNTITDFHLKGKAAGLYLIKVVTASGTKDIKVLVQ
jgi:hypothetical protein